MQLYCVHAPSLEAHVCVNVEDGVAELWQSQVHHISYALSVMALGCDGYIFVCLLTYYVLLDSEWV